jgi:AraC family transcriptional activator of tynA and feaB
MTETKKSSWYQWSTKGFRPRERTDAWQAALNQSHLSWNLSQIPRRGFAADIQVGRLQDLQVARCVCQPCSGFRQSLEIAQSKAAYYGLLLLYDGQEEVEVGSRRALLGPGSSLLWDSTEPIRFKLHSPVCKTTVFVPQKRLQDALPQTRRLVGVAFDWRRGLGAVTASHISALGSHICYIDNRQAESAAETTLELIAISLGSQDTRAGDSQRAGMLARIKEHVESHLNDDELGPRTLARRFGISLRYVHLLFAGEGITASRYILERRLERCRRELKVVGSHKNVTEVAIDWGFNDPAYFSRVFKKRYGLSPLQYRRNKTSLV